MLKAGPAQLTPPPVLALSCLFLACGTKDRRISAIKCQRVCQHRTAPNCQRFIALYTVRGVPCVHTCRPPWFNLFCLQAIRLQIPILNKWTDKYTGFLLIWIFAHFVHRFVNSLAMLLACLCVCLLVEEKWAAGVGAMRRCGFTRRAHQSTRDRMAREKKKQTTAPSTRPLHMTCRIMINRQICKSTARLSRYGWPISILLLSALVIVVRKI